MDLSVSEVPEYQKSPLKYYQVDIKNPPSNYNGPGSLVPYASIITELGRMMINNSISKALDNNHNSLEENGARVYYCDTDSIIMNKKAFENLEKSGANMNESELGGLKKEHLSEGPIRKLRVIGKKVYMYKIGKEWHVKFKGVKDPTDKLYKNIKNLGVFKPQ